MFSPASLMKEFIDKHIGIKYSASKDILTAEWPDVTEENKEEIKNSIAALLKFLREQDIKNLLIDNRKGKVSIPDSEYTAIVQWFTKGLTGTNLERIARVQSADPKREAIVDRAGLPIYSIQYSIRFQEFTNFNEACCWLRLTDNPY